MAEAVLDMAKLRAIPAVRELLGRVASLPINDAAFEIWRNRSSLPGHERDAGLSPPLPDKDLSDWNILRGEMQAAYRRVSSERHEIETKPAYRWLRLVRPQAGNTEILDAIASVWKLEDDFQRHSARLKDDDSVWTTKIRKAMAGARADNPVFSESTFERFEFEMFMANR